MERLRHVARAEGVPQSTLVGETAEALLDVVDDHAGLVTACRQMVNRQPTSGPLVWLAASLLAEDDPRTVVWDLVEAIHDDPTDRELAHALPDGAAVVIHGWPELLTRALARRGDISVMVIDGPIVARHRPEFDPEPVHLLAETMAAAVGSADLVVLEASAAGPNGALVPMGGLALAVIAGHVGVPVWLLVGRGRGLIEPLWRGLRRRLPDPERPWESPVEVVPVDLVARVVSPIGPSSLAEAVVAGACPAAAELH